MSQTPSVVKTEITLEQGKSLDTSDIVYLLAQQTKLVVMVLFQHYEEWTPFTTSFKIDSHENIFKQIDDLAKSAKSVQCEDIEDILETEWSKKEYSLLINGGASNATQTVCTLFNLDIDLLTKFLNDRPQIERL